MTVFATAADGVRLAYEIAGGGTDIVFLVHGFGSSRAQNWHDTGWYDTLAKAGYRVVAMDARGHGESDKPHASEGYGHAAMAKDVLAVMDAADIAAAHVMGYSMGGFIAIQLAAQHPGRLRKLVVAGVGESYLDASDRRRDRVADPLVRAAIVAALRAPDPATIENPTARTFRAFADQPGKDRLALAACMAAPAANLPAEALARIALPVLVVCGEKDDLTGRPEGLAAAFAHGRAVTVPGRDHMTAVGDKLYKGAVLDFLAGD
ncbi:MAG: alpha/beta hydrolase [Rhizomicrobium sp.]